MLRTVHACRHTGGRERQAGAAAANGGGGAAGLQGGGGAGSLAHCAWHTLSRPHRCSNRELSGTRRCERGRGALFGPVRPVTRSGAAINVGHLALHARSMRGARPFSMLRVHETRGQTSSRRCVPQRPISLLAFRLRKAVKGSGPWPKPIPASALSQLSALPFPALAPPTHTSLARYNSLPRSAAGQQRPARPDGDGLLAASTRPQ